MSRGVDSPAPTDRQWPEQAHHRSDEPPAARLGEVVLDKYRIERVLGSGGMGMVYQGRHEVLGRRVAVKYLHRELASRPDMLERFRREALVASTVESEHVAAVIDCGREPDGPPFVVMEYLEGESLADLLRHRRALPLPRALEMVIQTCYGLEAAHDRGIVHRDLKPDNLFVCRRADGTDLIKILDFGIAKLVDRSAPTITSTGVPIGTPYYMAREQARGLEDVDRRADVHALGVILYEMLSGQVPHPGESYSEVLSHILLEPPQPLDRVRPGLPVALVEIVHRAIEPDRSRRTATARELRLALKPLLAAKGSLRPPARRGHGGDDATLPSADRHDTAAEAAKLDGGHGEGQADGVAAVGEERGRDAAPAGDDTATARSREASTTEAAMAAAGLRPRAPSGVVRPIVQGLLVGVAGTVLFGVLLSAGLFDGGGEGNPAARSAPMSDTANPSSTEAPRASASVPAPSNTAAGEQADGGQSSVEGDGGRRTAGGVASARPGRSRAEARPWPTRSPSDESRPSTPSSDGAPAAHSTDPAAASGIDVDRDSPYR